MEALKERIERWVLSNSGYGLIEFNGNKVYYIDSIATVISSVHLNTAKGYIVNSDLTTAPCFIVKDGKGHFAHGDMLKNAQISLTEKILEDMSEEERIESFLAEFDVKKTYKGHEFYKWHHILTGSCEFGRNAFVKDNGIDLDKGYTVEYFLSITENSYGGDIIRQIKERYGL